MRTGASVAPAIGAISTSGGSAGFCSRSLSRFRRARGPFSSRRVGARPSRARATGDRALLFIAVVAPHGRQSASESKRSAASGKEQSFWVGTPKAGFTPAEPGPCPRLVGGATQLFDVLAHDVGAGTVEPHLAL